MRGGVHVVLAGALLTALAVAGCTTELRAEGEPCFASSECAAGLLCDLAAEPPVCRMGGAGGMTPEPDAAAAIDAGIDPADAAPRPDGSPEPPDAAPPDAAPPDAAPPDAAPPDAAI